MHLLLIEDDRIVANYIKKGMKQENHIVEHHDNGTDGLHAALTGEYDVMIIDRHLPQIDGLDIIKTIRNKANFTPILILSGMNSVPQRVEGLQSGANDYLTKPYAFSELLARVRNLGVTQRHNAQVTSLQVSDLALDLLSQRVERNQIDIPLRPLEFKLLKFLMENVDKIMTRAMLFEQVWEYHYAPQTNVIDVHIGRLRNKIDKPFTIPLIHTVPKAGYVLKQPVTKVV